MSSIIFGTGYSARKVKLIEVNDEIVKEIEAGQNTVSIKGRKNGDAVLCTSSHTYSLRMVESSNTLMLLNNNMQTASSSNNNSKSEVVAGVNCEYELTLMQGRTQQLEALLNQKSYAGSTAEANRAGPTYTLQQLQKRVQASSAEIAKKLEEVNAFELEGKWRVMETTHMNDTLEYLLTTAASKGWDLFALSEHKCMKSLQKANFDTHSVQQTLKTYATQAPTPGSDGDSIWKLDAKKIIVFRAIQLLSLTNKNWPLSSFLEQWKANIPDGITDEPTIEMLQGVAVVNAINSEAPIQLSSVSRDQCVIHYFPISMVTSIDDARTRFRLLFQQQKYWNLASIQPYIIDLVPPGSNVEQYVLKYARAHPQPASVTLYSSKE